MEITSVEPVRVGRWLLVRVHTDEGITGLGEAGTWGFLDATERAIETMGRYLVGRDPLRIEHHWQSLYRFSHFRGAVVSGALSAIDVALWDVAGKHHGVPAYRLLGGRCRSKARAYAHVLGDSTETLVEQCVAAKADGFTAVGHLSPFLDEPRTEPYFETHVAKMGDAADRIRAVRDAVGDDVDLCVEVHRRLDPAEAVVLARELEPYRPMFLEDPVRPDDIDAMARVADGASVPIATGERLHTVQEFGMLLGRDAAQYVRPDVCLAGGLTHTKKIAALAEAHYVQVVPHNPLSPVSTAASLQLAACIPNLALLEYPYRPDEGAPGGNLLAEPLTCEDGSLAIPERPGIGVELDEAAVEACAAEPRPIRVRRHEDGSVVDQ